MRPVLRGGLLAALIVALPGPAAAVSAPVADTSRLAFAVGPAFEAHRDLLASPLRQTGIGFGWAFGYRNGGFTLDVERATANARSALADAGDEGEDTWTGAFDLAWVRGVGDVGATSLRLGADLSGLVFVRRHAYGSGGREYFADLMVPLSAVLEAERRLDRDLRVEDRLSVAVAAAFFRSPFYATKEFPDGTFATLADLRLARNRLTLEQGLTRRTRLTVTHGLTVYDAARHREVRVVHQEVRLGVTVLLGGGGR